VNGVNPGDRRDEVRKTVVALIADIVDGVDLLGVEITDDTSFHEDLQLESIDLVTLAGALTDTYGPRVNLAEHLADLDLDEVIELRIGDIVDYVLGRITGRLDVQTAGADR
jgi:acyl carrier protein